MPGWALRARRLAAADASDAEIEFAATLLPRPPFFGIVHFSRSCRKSTQNGARSESRFRARCAAGGTQMEALSGRKLAAGVPAASAPPCAPGRGHRRLHCRSAHSRSCRAASGGARPGRPGGAAGGNGASMQSGKAGQDAGRGRATGGAAREQRTVALRAPSLPLATRKALPRFSVLVFDFDFSECQPNWNAL